MKHFIKKSALIALIAAFCITTVNAQIKEFPASERAKKIVKENIAIDVLTAPVWGFGWSKEEQMHEYFERARKTGIDLVGITVSFGPHLMANTMADMKKYSSVAMQHPDRYVLATSSRDVEYAHENGLAAIYFNSQTSENLDYDPSNMVLLKQLGIGTMLLSYNESFRAGDGGMVTNAWGEESKGLTTYGKKVIDAMVANRVMIDASHGSERLAMEIVKYVNENYPGVPVVCTHQQPLGAVNYPPRSYSDEVLKAVAKTGGVVCPIYFNALMGVPAERGDQGTPSEYAAILDYAVKVVGINHVGICTDGAFDSSPMNAYAKANPEQYDEYTVVYAQSEAGFLDGEFSITLPAVVDALMNEYDYSEEDVVKIIGGNWMRMIKTVWDGKPLYTPGMDGGKKLNHYKY